MVTGLEAAYASCEHAARSHYENFPVASWLVPAPMRKHIAALYAFAEEKVGELAALLVSARIVVQEVADGVQAEVLGHHLRGGGAEH